MNKEKEMVVPELRFSEFENEGDWKEKTLVNIAEIVTGTTPKTSESENYGGNKLFVSPADISGKRYISKTIKTLSEIGFSKSRVLPENSILFVCIGSTIGKIAQNKIECATNQQINSLIPFENYSNDFIYSLLENNSYRIASLAGHQAVPLINKTDFSEILVLLPPTKLEQQKIANCLSSLDNLITAETEKLDHLKDHKKGLLQQLFPTNGETKPQFRFLEFKNDGDWEITTLGKIAKFRRGSFPQPYGRPEWYDDENGMPFIQVYDVDTNLKIKPKTKRRISALAAEKSVFIAKGTVIITIQGSIGRVAITQYDAYIDRTLLLFEEFYKPIDKLFFAYVIQLLFEIEKEKAPGGIIKTITKEVLTSFNIYLPNVLEQQKIAKCLSSLDDLITAQVQKIKSLKKHKKGLMQQLFPHTI